VKHYEEMSLIDVIYLLLNRIPLRKHNYTRLRLYPFSTNMNLYTLQSHQSWEVGEIVVAVEHHANIFRFNPVLRQDMQGLASVLGNRSACQMIVIKGNSG
jgi:hypothetical protein